MNKNYLARLERDEVADPGSKAALRLARVLGVTADYLLVDKDEEQSDLLAAVASSVRGQHATAESAHLVRCEDTRRVRYA